MDKVEKIRQEIKRRYNYENEMYHKKKPDGWSNDGWAESLAIMGVLEELLTFLDTLSEEPDKSLEEVANDFANQDCVTFISRKKGFIAGAEWMAKQKEQKPAEWSEEDKDKVVQYLHDRDGGMLWSKATDITRDILDMLRPSWKPSENQMSMLLAVVNDPNNAGSASCHLSLESLYNDLKKL